MSLKPDIAIDTKLKKRPKKTVQTQIVMDEELNGRLSDFIKKYDVSKGALIRRAIRAYLDELDKEFNQIKK